MKANSLEPKPIHQDNETHQSTRNFTGTHKTASTQSQSSLCVFTPRVADCVWILPRIQNRVFLKLMSLAYSSDMVLCKQCQTSHVFHTSPRQSRQLTSFPPSAQAFADILFPSDTPIDYVLVTSTSQHKASYGDGGCHYRGSRSLCACAHHVFWFSSWLHTLLCFPYLAGSGRLLRRPHHIYQPFVAEIPFYKTFCNHVTSFLLIHSNSIYSFLCVGQNIYLVVTLVRGLGCSPQQGSSLCSLNFGLSSFCALQLNAHIPRSSHSRLLV